MLLLLVPLLLPKSPRPKVALHSAVRSTPFLMSRPRIATFHGLLSYRLHMSWAVGSGQPDKRQRLNRPNMAADAAT